MAAFVPQCFSKGLAFKLYSVGRSNKNSVVDGHALAIEPLAAFRRLMWRFVGPDVREAIRARPSLAVKVPESKNVKTNVTVNEI